MPSPTTALYPLPDMFIRFVIISTVAVVWCGLSIPVEGVDDAEENLGVQNCLKAIQDVQKDPNNGEMVKRFVDFCKEFIDEMDLSDNHTAILEQAGYKRSKKLKGKAEENEKQTIHKKGKTDDSEQKVTSDKKDHIKDPKISDKKSNDDGKNQKVPPEKTSEAGTHDSVTYNKEDKKAKEDIKQPKLHPKMAKPLKKVHKEAPKPDGKDKKKETVQQEEKISEPDKVAQTESEHQQSQESQIPQNEQVQSQNLHEELPLFDFSTFDIPGMTPEQLAKTIEDLKEVRRMIQMQQASQPQVQMHANFPDPNLQGFQEPQFGQQFGQGIPPFQYQEINAQFQNPAFVEGIPHVHMQFDQANGIPNPTFQQGIPPFPQQAEFAGHFQHQPFGQGIPQMPPASEWVAAFPDQQFGQGIPQPQSDAAANIVNGGPQMPNQQTIQPSNEAPTHEEPFTKRKIDEL